MLDINLVRERSELVKKNEKKRSRDTHTVDLVLECDTQWRMMLKKVEDLKHQRNVVSQEINKAKKTKKEKEAQQKIKEMQKVVEEIKKGEEEVQKLLENRDRLLLKLGNMMHSQVPFG